MPLQPGIYENEEGEKTLPFGDDENTPFTSTSLNGNGERDSPGVSRSTLKINFTNAHLGSPHNPNPNDSTETQHSRVLLASGPHDISWTQVDGITVKNASWMANGMELQNTAKHPHPPEEQTQDCIQLITANLVRLPLGSLRDSLQNYSGTDMHIRVFWEMNGGKRDDAVQAGYTQSGLFTVYNGNKEDDTYWRLARAIDEKKKNDPREESGANDVDWPTTSSSTSATSAIGTPTSPVNTPTDTNSIEAGSSGDGEGGGSELSAGAIAGIVIGAVFGLALVALLLWFLLRRRLRRRADHVQNRGYGSGPHVYLADKENHARVTDSPHSPYSDDGQQQQQHMQQSQRHLTEPALPVSADSPTEQPQQQRPFAPYDEEERSPITSHAPVASHTPVASRSVDNLNLDGPRSSTPNVNSNVSHLIEDGMTDDEIRRLEEEERALDAAIEQAGQGGHGQQQQQQQRR